MKEVRVNIAVEAGIQAYCISKSSRKLRKCSEPAFYPINFSNIACVLLIKKLY